MINETPNSSSENQEPIVFDFEENDFDFKPITKGLGFHKNKKEEKRSKVTPRKSATTSVINNFTDSSPSANPGVANSELAAFYTDEAKRIIETPEVKKEIKKQTKSIKLQKAPMFNQVAGFVIDLVLVSMATGLTVALLILISGLEYNILVKSLGELEIAKYILSLFVIYFMSYFTILDVAGTVGKSMMGVKLVHVEGKKLKLKHTFIRSIVTLLGFVALGLPSILDFQGRLSETKLVK